MKKRKIAILACISSFDATYSVAEIVRSQLHMLNSAGEKIVLIVPDDFTAQELVPKGVEIRYFSRYTDSVEPNQLNIFSFEDYTFKTSSILRNHLSDCTHCFQHDLLFIDSFIYLNWSIRKAAEVLPKLKWFHWQHSAPSVAEKEYPFNGCYLPMDNSFFIYLNRTDIPKVAERYKIPENQVQVVHNWVDFEKFFKLHPLSIELIQQYNLLDTDYLCIYPTRLSPAKQIDKLIKLLYSIQKKGRRTKLVVCNSWSNAEGEKKYLKELSNLIPDFTKNIIFTSQFESNWAKANNLDIELGVPHEVVSDLLRLADLFILPSTSECCSLVMLEAGLCKNLVILNEDLLSLHEFGGQKMNGIASRRAGYLSFGSISRPIETYFPSEDVWYSDSATKVIDLLESNQSLNFFRFVRTRHNPQWVYKNEIKPLLDF